MSSSSGLHARKKTSNHDIEDPTDIQIPESPSSKGIDDKDHRQKGLLRRYVRSEIGCAIEVVVGFLLFGLFLGYMILHHQQRKVILHIMHDPLGHIGHGLSLKGRSGFRHHFYTGHPRSVTVVMPSVVNPNRRTLRLDSISETWGGSARAVYVAHNISEYPEAAHAVLSENHRPEDPYSYPQLMVVPNSIGVDDGVERLMYVIRLVFEKINPDFAFFVNDHTFVIPEHLCKYLEHKNPNEDMYHGHAMKNDNSVFNSGAAGYILSRETMKKLVDQWDHNDPFCTGKSAKKWLQGNPGLLTSECMKTFGVTPADTRHHEIYHRFHAFPLTRMVSGDVDDWYLKKHMGMDELMAGSTPSYNTLLSGADCCAQDTISFHYVEYMESRALFATREALLKNPHMTDHELKGVMLAEWPREQKEVGGYSRGLPKESDSKGWEPLLKRSVIPHVIPDWSVSRVQDMQYMYAESTQFDQCLSIWAAKTPKNVNTTSMLLYTDCPNERDTPPPDYGPWCRNGADFRTHECTNHEEPEEEEKQEDHHEEKKRARTISRSSTHISEDRQ